MFMKKVLLGSFACLALAACTTDEEVAPAETPYAASTTTAAPAPAPAPEPMPEAQPEPRSFSNAQSK